MASENDNLKVSDGEAISSEIILAGDVFATATGGVTSAPGFISKCLDALTDGSGQEEGHTAEEASGDGIAS